MFDPTIFDNDIFDTPRGAKTKFGRGSRHAERRLFNRISFKIPIVGIPVMHSRLKLGILGVPFSRMNSRLSLSGIAYKVFKRRVEIRRKHGLVMLLEAGEL
jgi:hypothetical protein